MVFLNIIIISVLPCYANSTPFIHGYVAVKTDGSLWAWSYTERGAIVGPNNYYNIKDVKAVSEYGHCLVLKQDGTVWAWGNNDSGQLGLGNINSNYVKAPVKIPTLSNITAVCASGWDSMALQSDGTVWVWGSNYEGITGIYTENYKGVKDVTINTPQKIPNLKDVVQISLNMTSVDTRHASVLKKDGTVWQWGFLREIGKSIEILYTPVQLKGFTNVKQISDDYLLKKDGTVWYYSLMSSSFQVKGLTGIKSISSSGDNRMDALKEDGTLWEFATYMNGTVGDPRRDLRLRRINISDVESVFTGPGNTFAIKKDKSIWAWGNNFQGQLLVGDASSWIESPMQCSFDLFN